jgi:hypothetical protein
MLSDDQFPMSLYHNRASIVAAPMTHYDTGRYTHEFGPEGTSHGYYATPEQYEKDTGGSITGKSEVQHIAERFKDDPGGWEGSEWTAEPSQGMLFDPEELGRSEFKARYQATRNMGINPRLVEAGPGSDADRAVRSTSFEEQVRATIANSTIPLHDLRQWAAKSEGGRIEGRLPREGEDAAGYAHHTGLVELLSGWGKQPSPQTIVHEIGHQAHIPEHGGKITYPHYNDNPNPTAEGIADAYMDVHTHPVDAIWNERHRPYATAVDPEKWNPTEVATYLTTRRAAAETGTPPWMHALDTRMYLGNPMVDPEDPTLHRMTSYRADLDAGEMNRTLAEKDVTLAKDIKAHHDWVNGTRSLFGGS